MILSLGVFDLMRRREMQVSLKSMEKIILQINGA